MPFDWRFRNFKRDPQPFLNGAVTDAENARNNLIQNAGNSMEGYTPLESTLAAQAMEGYRPVVPATQSQLAAGAAQAMEGYTPNSVGRPSVPNDMHGGMGQPDLEGYGESLQAASEAAGQAQAKEQKIADIESQIATLEKRIAENQAKLQNFAGNADQIAALEARKINAADPTSIWRWKVDRDEARRIANAQNKPNDTAKANALIEATNTIENMVVDPSMDTPTKNAMLSKLADIKSNLQKNGLPTKMVDDKMSEIKGENKQVVTEEPETDKPEDFEFEGTDREQGEARAIRILQKDPEKLTQNEIMTLKRDIQSGKISVSNETKNKIDKIHSQIIDRDKKRVEADKKEERLLKKGKNLSSEDLEFLKGRKGLKHHSDSYGNEWYTRG